MTDQEQVEAAIRAVIDGGALDGAIVLGLGVAGILLVCIIVVLPWLFLHYLTKAKAAGALSADQEQMLEDLWRSAKSLERRMGALEQIMDVDANAPTEVRIERPIGGLH